MYWIFQLNGNIQMDTSYLKILLPEGNGSDLFLHPYELSPMVIKLLTKDSHFKFNDYSQIEKIKRSNG